jgi:hypothetical protein
MSRSILLLCAGMVMAVCAACEGTKGVTRPTQPAAMCSSDGSDFLKHIFVLKVLNPIYDPSRNPYAPPPVAGPFDTTQLNIKNDIVGAFNSAPTMVKNHLCGLTAIYIDPSVCTNQNPYNCTLPAGPTSATSLFTGAWGFRSRNQPDKGSTYISVSAALWPQGQSASDIYTYENTLLQAIAIELGGQAWSTSANFPSIGIPANPNSASALTVLAAMAHEMGHVFFIQTAIKNAGNDFKFGNLTSCALGNGTTIDFFLGWAHHNDHDLDPPKWRKFADSHNNSGGQTEHQNKPKLAEFQAATGQVPTLNQLVHDSYVPSQPWASLFGALTPDEDFVETYALYALVGNGLDGSGGPFLASLPVTIPLTTGTVNVPSDLLGHNKTDLQNKISCLKVVLPVN